MSKKAKAIVLGVDIGNAYTKTSEGVRFLSKVGTNYGAGYRDKAYSVEWNQKRYLVGDDEGKTFTTSTKYDDDNYKVTLLTAISLSVEDINAKDIDVSLILGTPVEQHDELADVCRRSALELGKQTININGFERTINIVDVGIAPQSAIIDEDSDRGVLVVDFGGGTLDICIWGKGEDDTPVKFFQKTLPDLGFDKIIEEFRNKARTADSRHPIELTYTQALKLLDNPILKSARGERNYTELRDSILTEYSNKIRAAFDKNNVPELYCQVKICGGCAEVMESFITNAMGFVKEFVSVENNPQFANALAYERLGNALYNTNVEVVE